MSLTKKALRDYNWLTTTIKWQNQKFYVKKYLLVPGYRLFEIIRSKTSWVIKKDESGEWFKLN